MSNENFISKRYAMQERLQRIRAAELANNPPVVIETVQAPVRGYRGVFRYEQKYLRGESCTFAGSTWYCNIDTSERPGDGNPNWTLSNKRGADGKDGARGPRGEQGEQGEPGKIPDHKWSGTALAFERPDGTLEKPVDLRGPPGPPGQAAFGGAAVIPQTFGYFPQGW